MENRSEKLFKSLKRYYTEDRVLRVLEVIEPVDHSAKHVSLRLIDWLVTNYSKHHKVVYASRNGTTFNLHQSYKNMLKAYSKKMFDPFKRHDRVYIEYGDSCTPFETTVAQLTFFKWAIENGVLDFADAHRDRIKADMDKAVRRSANNKVVSVK